MESYNAFMIDLLKEMKSTAVGTPKIDTKWIGIPKLKINVNGSPGVAEKRKRSDDNKQIEQPSKSPPFSNRVFSNTPIQLPSLVSNSVSKIGSGISVKRVNPKITDATTVSVTSDFNNTENDDVIFVPNTDPLKPNAVKDPKKSFNAACYNTNLYMFLSENRTISPSHTDRRQTINSPMVSVPKKEPSGPNMMELNTSNKNILIKSGGLIIGKSGNKVTESNTVDLPVIKVVNKNGKKVLLSKAIPITPTGQSVDKGKETRLNATLPALHGLPTTRGMAAQNRLSLQTANQSETQSMNLFKCNQCDYATEVKSNFDRHALVHRSIQRFKCKHCQMKFIQKINLISHLRQNHKELQLDIAKYWEGI